VLIEEGKNPSPTHSGNRRFEMLHFVNIRKSFRKRTGIASERKKSCARDSKKESEGRRVIAVARKDIEKDAKRVSIKMQRKRNQCLRVYSLRIR